jgi:tetratricopeptide (TPR) repeat protein
MPSAARLLLLGAIAILSLAAQAGGGIGDSTPTTGGGIRGPDTSRSLYISGKVVMQDGSPVLPNIAVQRVCSGISKIVAFTGSDGRFSFQWSDSSRIVTDTADGGSSSSRESDSEGFGNAQSAGGANALASDPFGRRMMNCELRASLAGFTSDTVRLFNHGAGSPDIGIIVLTRVAGVAGSSISVTAMRAPKNARKAYEDGLRALLRNKPADASRDFEKAVALYPQYADAWVQLAKLLIGRQSIAPARAALRKAMDSDPNLVAPYMELGLLAAKDANWRESAGYLDRAVELDPVDFPQAWYADAVANYNLQKYDAAERGARVAVKLDSRHANPRSEYLLGLVLAEKHDYAGAVAELRTYLTLAPNAPDLAQAREQLGQFEKVAGGK